MKHARLNEDVKLRVPPDMKRELERLAAVEMISVSDVVRKAVMTHIKRSNGKEISR